MFLLAYTPLAKADFRPAQAGQQQLHERDISYRLGDAPFEQVRAIADGWTSQAQRPFKGGDGPVVLWVRFKLPAVDTSRTLLLHADLWEQAEFYFVRDGVLIGHAVAGGLAPRSARALQVATIPGFAGGFAPVLALPNAGTEVYVRLRSERRLFPAPALRIDVFDQHGIQEGEQRAHLMQGMFIGIIGFLIIYNLGLFLVVREPGFLSYVILESGSASAWLIVFGVSFEFLWPEHPMWDAYALWCAIWLGGLGIGQFLRHYLATWQHFPILDKLLLLNAVFDVLVIPLPLLPLPWAFGELLTLQIRLIPIAGLIVAVVLAMAWRARHPQLHNLMLAMSCYAFGLVSGALAAIGVLPGELFAHAGQLGSIAAGIILSLGLGYKLQSAREQLVQTQLAEQRDRLARESERRALIEEQNRTLEARVLERTKALALAQEKSDALLANILPQAIIEELRESGVTEPRRHDEATILFTDFSGFTQAVAAMPPRRLVQELNDIFRAFDDIVAQHGLEKIKTIGDAYMAAGGLPVSAADHALRCVRAAVALTRFIESRNLDAPMKWGLRVGVHSGAVVAGVVGKSKYAYDVWGDTVNIASRLESAGAVNRVNISAYTYDLVSAHFKCEYRGKVEAKGKGALDMYFVLEENV
ncbi:MAG: adenylate/guanylate cyclase domain-containing protein [Pseudomonadota bacterium]